MRYRWRGLLEQALENHGKGGFCRGGVECRRDAGTSR